jgi:hypothetical protein
VSPLSPSTQLLMVLWPVLKMSSERIMDLVFKLFTFIAKGHWCHLPDDHHPPMSNSNEVVSLSSFHESGIGLWVHPSSVGSCITTRSSSITWPCVGPPCRGVHHFVRGVSGDLVPLRPLEVFFSSPTLQRQRRMANSFRGSVASSSSYGMEGWGRTSACCF